MDQLTRFQILAEMVREYKTAFLLNRAIDKTGEEILEIINASGDTILYDIVLNAKLKREHPKDAVKHLDEATKYLHDRISEIYSNKWTYNPTQ